LKKEVVINGNVMNFQGHPDRYLENLSENNEFALTQYAKNHIPDNATILDIGSNIGFISCLFASYNPNSTVHAFEPGAQNFNFLRQNIVGNNISNVIPHNLAMGATNYIGRFLENSAWGHLESSANIFEPNLETAVVKTVDQFVSELDFKSIDLIKIDVEGFEMQVLNGMEKTLSRFNPKVILEFNTFCLICQGRNDPYSFLEFIKYTFKHKYIFSRNQDEERLLSKLEDENFERNLLHKNIIEHGSVDDILLFN
jgi:FkbM family methyltransferase